MLLHAYVDAAVRSERDRVCRSPQGQGNNDLFRAAAALGQWVGGGELTDAYVTSVLTDAASARGGLRQTEIINTIRSGLNKGRSNPRQLPKGHDDKRVQRHHQPPKFRDPQQFPIDHTKILETINRAPEIDAGYVHRRSPIDPDNLMADEANRYRRFIEALYTREDRVLIQTRFAIKCEYLWTKRSLFRITDKAPHYGKHHCPSFPEPGPDGLFFAFNPVTGAWMPNGKDEHGNTIYSRRCFKTIADWRYMLMESDTMPGEDWLKVICQHPLPIVSIVDTGGRSLHTLIRVDASGEADWKATGQLLIKQFSPLGMDPAPCKNAIEFSRIPGAWRKSKGKRQRLLYLNPQPEVKPIANLPELR